MVDPSLKLRETRDGLMVRLRVQPRARRCEISGVYNGALKIKVPAPPLDDAANSAVIEYLASVVGVSKSRISILSGAKSRDKVIRIKNMSLKDFYKKLDPHS